MQLPEFSTQTGLPDIVDAVQSDGVGGGAGVLVEGVARAGEILRGHLVHYKARLGYIS
jgi:hypothetical protein